MNFEYNELWTRHSHLYVIGDTDKNVYPIGAIAINITNDIKEEAFNKIKMISFLFRMKNINIHCKPNSLSAFEYFIYINKNIYADNQLTMDEYIHLIDSLRKHFKLKFRYVKDHCIKKDKQITFELIDNYVDLIDLNQKGFVGRSNFL